MIDQKLTVVIADDDPFMRHVLRIVLIEEGYHVRGEASTGKEAVELCLIRKPHIVLLDIEMPVMDGIEALCEIRTISSKTKVIMISSNSTLPKVREAVQKGASGFIVKPFTREKVLNSIKNYTSY